MLNVFETKTLLPSSHPSPPSFTDGLRCKNLSVHKSYYHLWLGSIWIKYFYWWPNQVYYNLKVYGKKWSGLVSIYISKAQMPQLIISQFNHKERRHLNWFGFKSMTVKLRFLKRHPCKPGRRLWTSVAYSERSYSLDSYYYFWTKAKLLITLKKVKEMIK